jgi:hypothetical protein
MTNFATNHQGETNRTSAFKRARTQLRFDVETAAQILEALTRLGASVKAVAPGRLRIIPASKVPTGLVSRVREAKLEILALLRERTATETVKPIECRYDWISGYCGLRLYCVVHKHADGRNTVFRTNPGGYDTLADLLRQGLLTGRALADAQRVS